MTVREAKQLASSFHRISSPTEEDVFLYTEALQFLINETKDASYMMELGGYYYGQRQFDLALKYYELGSEYHSPIADECLGYIWYYGRTGVRDYEKAFRYFSKAAERGNLVASYKLADMYKNGYYVEKSYGKYKQIIEELYPKVCCSDWLGDPLPEIFTRLARIRAEEGKTDEAVTLYRSAKTFLSQRIEYNDFFGNLNIMMWLVDDLYTLTPFDAESFDLFDLYWLLKAPCTVRFYHHAKSCAVTVTEEEDELVIRFEGSCYRNREDFFKKACIGSEKLTSLYGELYGFEME